MIPIQKRGTYKWWKGLYDLMESGLTQEAMNYVFERLDNGTFRSMRNSEYNMIAMTEVIANGRENKTINIAKSIVKNIERRK